MESIVYTSNRYRHIAKKVSLKYYYKWKKMVMYFFKIYLFHSEHQPCGNQS